MSPTSNCMNPNTLRHVGLILTMTASLCTASAAELPAASAAFTSRDPVVLKARALMDSGKFQKAEAMLVGAETLGDAQARRARAETLEIIRRTRIEYSLTQRPCWPKSGSQFLTPRPGKSNAGPRTAASASE